jgi:hypothetical protein
MHNKRKKMRILTRDQLKSLHVSEIKKLFLDVRSKINRGRKKNINKAALMELEIYYCYIFRELENKQWHETKRAS